MKKPDVSLRLDLVKAPAEVDLAELTDDERLIVELIIALRVHSDLFYRLAAYTQENFDAQARKTALADAHGKAGVACTDIIQKIACRLGLSPERYEELFSTIYARDSGIY